MELAVGVVARVMHVSVQFELGTFLGSTKRMHAQILIVNLECKTMVEVDNLELGIGMRASVLLVAVEHDRVALFGATKGVQEEVGVGHLDDESVRESGWLEHEL